MELYKSWVSKAYDKNGQSVKKVWDKYIPSEQKIYETIIKNKITRIEGSPKDLAEKYDVSLDYICGFIDGVNEAASNPIKIEELAEDQELNLEFSLEALYKKMVEFKADHLYNLPEWDDVISPEERKKLYDEQKRSRTVIKAPSPTRNDPCPCGSGKKYKKCCGIQ
ncbi:MAG: SEC-C domain-containing protein [Clostridiales bacterium]|nr:SEC-C domain-containing protein [Clostridiales bacterium]